MQTAKREHHSDRSADRDSTGNRRIADVTNTNDSRPAPTTYFRPRPTKAARADSPARANTSTALAPSGAISQTAFAEPAYNRHSTPVMRMPSKRTAHGAKALRRVDGQRGGPKAFQPGDEAFLPVRGSRERVCARGFERLHNGWGSENGRAIYRASPPRRSRRGSQVHLGNAHCCQLARSILTTSQRGISNAWQLHQVDVSGTDWESAAGVAGSGARSSRHSTHRPRRPRPSSGRAACFSPVRPSYPAAQLFGTYFDADDGRAIVALSAGPAAGRVFTYKRGPNGEWLDDGAITNPTPSAYDGFGTGVAVEGRYALVRTERRRLWALQAARLRMGQPATHRQHARSSTSTTRSTSRTASPPSARPTRQAAAAW